MEPSERAKQEEEILKFWEENKIFEQTLAKPAPRGEFVFYEGPPYANGLPGIHHLEARAFKDVILRYRTMCGYHVGRRAGWDTHGLPIEMAVEKKLGVKNKKEIEEKIGIDKFVAEAKANALFYKDEWEKFTKRIGYWLDFENAYLTMSPGFMESEWWIIKQAAEHGLLYRDYKILPWCPRCETALSSHELAQGYQEVEDPAIYVKFKVKDPEKHNLPSDTFLVAWTTTPWTLPSNTALAVGEGIEYTLLQDGKEHLVMASSKLAELGSSVLLASGSARPPTKQVSTSQLFAQELEGLEYEPLFNFPELQNDKSHRVYKADFVSIAEGSGIVHMAPMYGQDDFALGQEVGLPRHHLVGADGKFINSTPWAGKFVKDTDREIIADLSGRGLILREGKVRHIYPFCWRCKTPLIYYARDSWYLKMSQLKAKMLEENETVNWLPEHIKHGRFGEWLGEVKDWAVSRERYWGTPLPVWEVDGDDKPKKRLVIGSLEELKERVKKSGNRYFLLRHGEAESNAKNITNAKDDPPQPLTKRGEAMVHKVTDKFKERGLKFDRLFVSPLLRTRQTVEIVRRELSLPEECLLVDDRLKEIDTGEFHNRPIGEYRQAMPTYADRYHKRPKAGESLLEVRRRVGEFLYEIEEKYKGESILIVTHEYVLWMLTAIASGADETATFNLRQGEEDFIDVGESRPLEFIPWPHNEDYELDLHRPFIDKTILVDPDGRELTRVNEVLDVWFDSGAMPFAQNHFPFNQTLPYPADYIAEGVDQTRGWFYTLLAISAILDRPAPYKNVLSLGLMLDSKGKKMSKSVGNVVDPKVMIAKYGVDALRFWLYSVNQPGESKNFDEAGVEEVVKKVINLFTNTLSFYQLYFLEDVKETEVLKAPKHVMDRWILALLYKTVTQVGGHLENYQITEAARVMRDFIADLSQWYLRRSRDRFRGEAGEARRSAFSTLHFVLNETAKLLAPLMPFLAEAMYQKLRLSASPASIHLATWPDIKQDFANERMLTEMNEVRKLASLALEARARLGLKVRQPLSHATFRGKGELSAELINVLREEINVKNVEWSEGAEEEVTLDTKLTPELEREGKLRDLIRRVQDLRKTAKLNPSDSATLVVSGSCPDKDLILESKDELKLAVKLNEIKLVDQSDVPLSLSYKSPNS